MLTDSRDRLFDRPGPVGDFVFDAEVARVFPDMISRSVPGYAAIINMIELLTRMHAQPGTRLYDLGCSLGAASLAMARGLQHPDCPIIAVDNAPAMLERARAHARGLAHEIAFRQADIREVTIENASVVVLNFTLQFLPPADRSGLLRGIREGLAPGGILILSEKIAGETPEEDAVLVEMHHAFKRQQGYSELEISQKRAALERVLSPERLSTHRERLERVGFSRADVWFRCFNFVSIVARK
ncbi:MAG: carboxy-S-adenosyl-L-methionine synthase CmoA [Gammaproteobacteria bacterium]|nr:MAG: carboxy-S-adenosyl-L-methionine synthase CmoA [Gammaproteobacteria bacterium]